MTKSNLTGRNLSVLNTCSVFKFEKVCAFIFVFGLLGNGLTLWILVQSKKWKKNTTNMFIVSLTTVQDFDSTFKNYFGEYFSAILTSKLYEIVSLEVDQKIPWICSHI